MAGLLRAGAESRGEAGWRSQQRDAAEWVADFAAGGYGPHGAAKLVVPPVGDARWVRSPALALREAAVGPLLAPYADLAARIHRHTGDQCTAAVLVAARLVRAALDAQAPPVPAWNDGYALAWRQARAWLGANVVRADATRTLSAIAPRDWIDAALTGLPGLNDPHGLLDLDRIDVRAESVGPAWLDGVVIEPQEPPPAPGPVGVLLASTGWTAKPRSEGMQARVGDVKDLAALGTAEERRRGTAAEKIVGLGVGLVACGGALEEGVRGRLASRGVAVWTDVPVGAMLRLADASGAKAVARLDDATASDVGRGEMTRRPRRGWILRGAGPSATFVVPAESKPSRDAAVEQAERLLRAAGLVLAKPGALPGGGRWQRGLAASLRAAADAAPGHAPIAVRAAADTFAALADDLLRNAGRDALAGGELADAESVWDAAACVRLAVDGAFEVALALLRVDGAYARRPSAPADLRGGTAPAGSPRGMPGDIPPLM